MPELPEVETIRRQLNEVLPGRVIGEVEVLKEKSFMVDPPCAKASESKQLVVGYRITGVRRYGKALVIDLKKCRGESVKVKATAKKSKVTRNSKLETDNLSLVIHLKMTGQLIYEPHGSGETSHLKHRVAGGHPTGDFVGELPSKHTRVIFHFRHSGAKRSRAIESNKLKSGINSEGDPIVPHTAGLQDDEFADGILYFNDQRIFGWVKVVLTNDVERLSFISKLGKEPSGFSKEEWVKVFKSSKKAVKLRLMDQDKVAGVGNIYANDALWVAGINPERPANSLSDKELENLQKATIEVLDEGIKYGGATAQDGKYIDLQGLGGKYQEHFKVYQREGERCQRKGCKGEVERVKLGGRGTFRCKVCQR